MMNTDLQLYTPPKSSFRSLLSDWLDGAPSCHRHLPDSLLWCEMRELRHRRPSLARYLREARRAGFVVVGATIENDKITLSFADGSTATTSDNPWNAAIAKLKDKQ
jgi:hypothetical protein